jgi:serine/threonine protein phosphatase 1
VTKGIFSSVNNLTCKLNLPLGPSMRDPSLEADLQARLEDGHRLFVVGDIHGHLATFRALLHRLNLKPEDRVICLGDMIDRGPSSAELVALLRNHPQIICIKGNHEQMAIQCVQPDGTFEAWQPWMQRGGKSTYASYIVQAEGDLWEAKRTMLDDFMWLDTLPTQIVLDHLRLVHAGYDPRMPLDMQGEKELLWIRKEWFTHDGAVDPIRTVFFGHTTTTKLGDAAGDVAFSQATLADGRPAWVGLDVGAYNHVAPGLAAVNIGTFRVVKQPTLRCDRWFERIAKRVKKGKRVKQQPSVWQGVNDLKEAEISVSFGLTALALRARKAHRSTIKAQRKLELAGVVFPPGYTLDAIRQETDQGYRIVQQRQASNMPHGATSRGPTSFRVYRKTTGARDQQAVELVHVRGVILTP